MLTVCLFVCFFWVVFGSAFFALLLSYNIVALFGVYESIPCVITNTLCAPRQLD